MSTPINHTVTVKMEFVVGAQSVYKMLESIPNLISRKIINHENMIHVRIMCMMYLLWLVCFQIDNFMEKRGLTALVLVGCIVRSKIYWNLYA